MRKPRAKKRTFQTALASFVSKSILIGKKARRPRLTFLKRALNLQGLAADGAGGTTKEI